MKQTMGRLGVGIVLTASLLMGAGCGGTGKTVYLNLQQKQAAAQFMEPEPVRIVIEPFEDRRLEKNRARSADPFVGWGDLLQCGG